MNNEQLSEAKASGLSDEEIEYLRRPLKAAEYQTRYGITKDILEKMIGSGQLRAVRCGDALWVQDAPKEIPGLASSAETFLKNLWEGNLGLAMTYWVYGVLGGVVWAASILALNLQPDTDSARLVLLLMGAYYVVVYVGIWRAASKYRGNKLWEVLAKFIIVVTVLPTVIQLFK